ncbi:MAG: hypothetical protein WB424_00835 [Terracidiphilus sp.]
MKMKSHQPRLRVVAWVLQNRVLLRQALHPACGLKIIIRIEGAGAGLHLEETRLELAPEVSMTLIEVEQSGRGRVKQNQQK